MTCVIGGAFAYWTYRRKQPTRKALTWAVICLIAALLILIVYTVLLRVCTVYPDKIDPKLGYGRVQIGFGMAPWSLIDGTQNDYVRILREKGILNPTPSDLLEWNAKWSDYRSLEWVRTVWRPWSVYLAGCVLVVTFLVSYVLWIFGWVVVVRYFEVDQQRRSRSQQSTPENKESLTDHE